MATTANISVNNGAATPVAQVYSARAVGPETAEFQTTSQTTLIGRQKIVYTKKRGKDGMVKLIIRCYNPVIVTVTDANGSRDVKSYELSSIQTLFRPERATVQEAKDSRVISANVALHATTAAIHDNDEWFHS